MWEVLVTSLKATVPKAADATLRMVGIKLLGKLLEIPEVWADGYIQGKKDEIRAKSIFSDGLTTKALEAATENNALLQSVADDLLETHWTRAKNKGQIFRKAVARIAASEDANFENAAVPNDDWMAAFGRLAEDISGDAMRETFARILAGEVENPGSFSISTLRIISGMNQHVAAEFAEICNELIGDCIFRRKKYSRGSDWLRMTMLRNEGLFSPVESSIHQPRGTNSWSVQTPKCWIEIECTPDCASEIPIFNLTAAGLEIAMLLPEPDFEQNLRILVAENEKKIGWKSVILARHDGPIEKIQ